MMFQPCKHLCISLVLRPTLASTSRPAPYVRGRDVEAWV